MIGIGGAIGTGLFMGAGGRLHSAGPGLFLVYAVCGVFVFFILRALGELILHRPSSGSFVSYAREFLGEKAAYVAGWMYFFNWAATAIVDVTAIALYMHYWSAFKAIPQWSIALIALVIVLTMNTISVKLFGEMEFWAALIKVVAIMGFLVIGTVFLAGRFTVEGASTGPSVIADNGGLLPTGLMALVIVTSGVVFAYSAVELVGIAAGETENPDKVMPRAINSVVFRVAVFYVGSLILLALLLPYGYGAPGIRKLPRCVSCNPLPPGHSTDQGDRRQSNIRCSRRTLLDYRGDQLAERPNLFQRMIARCCEYTVRACLKPITSKTSLRHSVRLIQRHLGQHLG